MARHSYYESYWRPYVPVAQRRREAEKLARKLAGKGRKLAPVEVAGRTIASSFWGKAWCEQFEGFSDFSNRLPRGRTYVRNGSVIDLQVSPGEVRALVSGSEVYTCTVAITALPPKEWRSVVGRCRGQIESVLDLLQGKLSSGVMAVLTDRDRGLLPRRRQIQLDCTCPDWATLCKHLAAVLYGVGHRLDHQPELLFTLRGVDHAALIAEAAQHGAEALLEGAGSSPRLVADEGDLGTLFGIDLGDGDEEPEPSSPGRRRRKSPARRPAAARKATAARGRGPTKAAKRPPPAAIRLPRVLTSADLLALGIPRSTFANWVTTGVLARTSERGVYRKTRQTLPRVKKALEDRGLR